LPGPLFEGVEGVFPDCLNGESEFHTLVVGEAPVSVSNGSRASRLPRAAAESVTIRGEKRDRKPQRKGAFLSVDAVSIGECSSNIWNYFCKFIDKLEFAN